MESKTIEFFYEISKIPRESGNEKQISDFICEFARKRNLEYIQDKYGNVIVKKKTLEVEPLILQAHLDMVCEKEEQKEFDFNKDSIEVYEENGYLKARGTTLGADNGIGVAQILNILDSDIKCNLECIFTVSEETTMVGAENIDVSMLKGKKMINLDSFKDNTITIESASFSDIILRLKYEFQNRESKSSYKIKLNGLLGGHSGFDIDKNRGNSNILLAKLINKISDIEIAEFIGGTKFNVIPNSAEAIFLSKIEKEKLQEIIKNFLGNEKKDFNDLTIELEETRYKGEFLNTFNSQKFLNAILNFRHGVINKNEKQKPTTSVNLGVVDLKGKFLKVGMRSSKEDERKNILEELKKYADNYDFKFEQVGFQEGFSTKEEAKLVKDLKKAHSKVLKDKPLDVKSIHITVEAGFFKNKIKDLEIAIISPKIIGAHTPYECVEIESIKECDLWLKEYLIQN